MTKMALAAILMGSTMSQLAIADICDYRPSNFLGETATTATGVVGGTAAATGVGMKVAGLYTITHASSGAVMLGSTAAGASAAGTTGIIAGTAGFLGSVGAVLMSPFVIVPAAVAAVSIGVYEGGCYLAGGPAAEEQGADK